MAETARDLIEPAARNPGNGTEQPTVAEVGASIAISLKRIADALDACIDFNRDAPWGPAVRTQNGDMRS